ncbi:OVCH1 protein, partial [Crotophaga sulcirostris]|nr:OVCH1 protein [Crotophaga sulcirostris]
QVRQMKTTTGHPYFVTLSYDSNIALMQLGVPQEHNIAVRSMCLSNSKKMLSSSSLCTVSGCGDHQRSQARWLQQTQVPVPENEICERNYYFNHPEGITARMLCAGFVSVGGQKS